MKGCKDSVRSQFFSLFPIGKKQGLKALSEGKYLSNFGEAQDLNDPPPKRRAIHFLLRETIKMYLFGIAPQALLVSYFAGGGGRSGFY